MRFCLIHVDDEDLGPEETAMVVVPGAGKTALEVPLDALPQFLPLLAEATADLPAPICRGCGGELPGGRWPLRGR